MNIRSVTCFCNPSYPVNAGIIRDLGRLARQVQTALSDAGHPVQTRRLATVPFPELVSSASETMVFAKDMMEAGKTAGFDYTAIGPALPDRLWSYAVIPDVIRSTENLFVSGVIADRITGISLPAIRACARLIQETATVESTGFGNLYFTALANVPPGGPYYPSAYHRGDSPCFALAVEAADLAVDVFDRADSLESAQTNWIQAIESGAESLTAICDAQAEAAGIPFTGMDFTPASFPTPERSIGRAMELLGIDAVGYAGSLAVSAFITDSLDRAVFRRAGFNGLMLPVLEDSILAQRAAERVLTLNDLLMYSAVCGTGLDTVPVPGDVSEQALSGVLLDLAALSLRLNKPLTARLMPVPGKAAGEMTEFDFPYFANSRILPVRAGALHRFFATDKTLSLQSRT